MDVSHQFKLADRYGFLVQDKLAELLMRIAQVDAPWSTMS